MRFLCIVLLAIACGRSWAQVDTATVPHSENGWYLSPHGVIRVLVLFAEIEYDKTPNRDPQKDGAEHWKKGQLPRWKNDLFDPQPSPLPKAMVSRYYHDVSLGGFEVLGDYVDRMFTLRESEYPGLGNVHGINALVIQEANKLGALHTAHDLQIEDFDTWKRGGKPGMPKVNTPDDPHSYDHIMVILRNSQLTHGQGSTDAGSSGKLYGFESDSQSRFGGMNALPFEILKHEFNHLLLGGNNFHSGGGNAAGFDSYTICPQGGWSLMGAASSSLLTCSAWDRDRLGWRGLDGAHSINARTLNDAAINGDLDPMAGDTGVFILRDFVTSGDALRIRMPFLPTTEYPQWLWIENHQCFAKNGSPTDRFHWEADNKACLSPAVPGLYMMMQVDREKKSGKDIYGGFADYLHPLTASGHYDYFLASDTLHDLCPFNGTGRPYVVRDRDKNPLSGNSEQELIVWDRNADGKVERGEHFVPGAGYRDGRLTNDAAFFGAARHVFTPTGNAVLGMGTNPSSANMLTLIAGGKREKDNIASNNRTVYLNGIRVQALEQRANGDLIIRVSTGDTRLTADVRWCADSIVLPPLKGSDGRSLTVATGTELLLDRSRTPTRMTVQEKTSSFDYFAPPTHFTISSGARVWFERKSSLHLDRSSVLHVMPGAELAFDKKAKLTIDSGSRIILHGNAKLTAKARTLKKLRKKGRIVPM